MPLQQGRGDAASLLPNKVRSPVPHAASVDARGGGVLITASVGRKVLAPSVASSASTLAGTLERLVTTC